MHYLSKALYLLRLGHLQVVYLNYCKGKNHKLKGPLFLIFSYWFRILNLFAEDNFSDPLSDWKQASFCIKVAKIFTAYVSEYHQHGYWYVPT